jgi:choloylglycine hydrolase
MCTAVSWRSKDHYFGRNLDLEFVCNESVTVTPRNFPFQFRNTQPQNTHYAIIGMATMMDGYPLYFDATNEKGLSMAGLNFPGNAVYPPARKDRTNVAPFEFIPWLLGQCADVIQARKLLLNVNLADIAFSKELPPTPLHWLIADRDQSIVVEPMADGIHIYENPVGVLTNNPPFDFHLHNLGLYLNVSAKQAVNRFSEHYPIAPWSSGMGGLGLPGDFSSASRFVKATFVKLNSLSGSSEEESVSQFFHILSSVAMPRGSVRMGECQYEITRYSSCCNTDKGIYYYTTYENSQISAVDMTLEDLNGAQLICYPLMERPQILIQNGQKGW